MYMPDDYIYLLTGDTLADFDQKMNVMVDPFATHITRLGRLMEGNGKEIHGIGMDFISLITKATSNPEIHEICTRLAESMDKQLSYYEEFQEACESILEDIVTINQSFVNLYESMVCGRQDLPVEPAGT